MCLAVLNYPQEALSAIAAAADTTDAVEVKVLEQAVRAVVAANEGKPKEGAAMFALAERYGVWDPVVAALRASEALRLVLSDLAEIRTPLELLYQRSNDLALARRAGFRTRSSDSPKQLLSPRELEVLELIARGFRNRDVAKALVISDSTTKVHVRHILEKLGVRTRTEAVARLELFR
jgi:DNA-binding NarL/FixJ family response regulator